MVGVWVDCRKVDNVRPSQYILLAMRRGAGCDMLHGHTASSAIDRAHDPHLLSSWLARYFRRPVEGRESIHTARASVSLDHAFSHHLTHYKQYGTPAIFSRKQHTRLAFTYHCERHTYDMYTIEEFIYKPEQHTFNREWTKCQNWLRTIHPYERHTNKPSITESCSAVLHI